MRWFGGSIAEAVTLSKKKNAIFVVFVEGDNDMSTELATTIDTRQVVKRLSNQDNFLAIKLKSGTDNYTYFAQIYQFVPVPSLFFIGRNGTPLEVVCAGIEPDSLAGRIDLILTEHLKEEESLLMKPSTSSECMREQSSNLIQAEATASAPMTPAQAQAVRRDSTTTASADDAGPAAKIQKTDHHETKAGQEYEVVCEGDVCERRPKTDQHQAGPSQSTPVPQAVEPVASSSSSISMEEKMDRAKELIEIKRREKAEKEKELEKQKELERRSVGQGVAELKKWQADQELKQIQEERKREKMENNLARQRILEQIAQDRAERRARDVPVPQQQVQQQQQQQQQANVSATGGDGAELMARLQLKLPDGSTHSAQFPAVTSLEHVQRYIADQLKMTTSQFSLWTAFPRRELTDAEASLQQLQLVPSAALLLLPRRSELPPPAAAAHSTLFAFLSQLLTTLVLDPTYQIIAWIRGQLFPGGGAAPSVPEARRPQPPPPPTEGLRRRGNVHRITGDHSGDDDNNTWNGNSTQQM